MNEDMLMDFHRRVQAADFSNMPLVELQKLYDEATVISHYTYPVTGDAETELLQIIQADILMLGGAYKLRMEKEKKVKKHHHD